LSETDKREELKKLLKELHDRQPDTDDFPGTGVVLDCGIRHYCNQFDLIKPFRPERGLLKPANYRLCVGDEYAIGGAPNSLSAEPGKNKLRIPPFQVAVIKTREIINMPPFLIGRWNIQVKRAYQGLLWVGGPQVDAGYVGYLFCPVYNLSDEEVELEYDEPFAVIDFVKTTHFDSANCHRYKFPPDLLTIEDCRPLRSALVTFVTKRLEEFQAFQKAIADRQDKQERSTEFFITVALTLTGILFAALAIIVTREGSYAFNSWSVVSLVISIVALFAAIHQSGARNNNNSDQP